MTPYKINRIFVVQLLLPVMALLLLHTAVFAADAASELEAGYFRDDSQSLTIQELTNAPEHFQPATSPFVLSHHASHWFRYNIPERSATTPAFLRILFPSIDAGRVYLTTDQSTFLAGTIGDDVKHTDWPMRTRLPNIPLQADGRQVTEVYLELEATGQVAVLPVLMVNYEQFVEREKNESLWYGFFFGTTLLLIVYNLVLYLSSRIRSYKHYVAYLASFTLLQASITGVGQQYLWPTLSGFTTLFALGLIALTNCTMILFVCIFLELKTRRPRAETVLTYMAYVSLLPLPALFFVDYIHVQSIQHVYSLISMLVITVISVLELRSGSRPALFLLASYVLLFSGIIMALLLYNGLLETSFLTTHLMEIAIILEALILSLGLADQITSLRNRATALEIKSKEDQMEFTRKLVSAHESEKQSFGAILHDDIGHQVLNLQYGLSNLAKSQQQNPDVFRQQLDTHINSTNDILQDLRYLAASSHPHLLSQLGFSKAMESLLAQALTPMNINYSVFVDAESATEFQQQQLYRIVQELVTNTVKHANASEVVLNVSEGATDIRLLYKDDGEGIAQTSLQSSHGFGLVSIRERCKLLGGELHLKATPDKGFNLQITGIPLNAEYEFGVVN